MNKQNKYNFVKNLMNKPNLSAVQLRKILELASREFPEGENYGNEILEKLNKIERRLINLEDEKNKEKFNIISSSPSNENLPNYFDCSNTSKFLIEYNKNTILKTTCHLIDSNEMKTIINEINKITNDYEISEYNFDKHYELICKNFDKLDENEKAPSYLKALIRGYLTGKDYKGNQLKNGWSSDQIKINWNCKELKDWTKKRENKGVPPNLDEDVEEILEKIGFEFEPIKSKITLKSINTFSKLIIHFKHLFHIRYDNSLKNIVENINRQNKSWKNINFVIEEEQFLENIELFTDVDKLTQAYKIIIKLILEVSKDKEGPIIKLSFREDKNKDKIFSIHHINSTYCKSLNDTLLRIGSTYQNLIKNQINGLCDLYLKAAFEGGECAEINLWNGEQRVKKIISESEEFEGVEHILKFKK